MTWKEGRQVLQKILLRNLFHGQRNDHFCATQSFALAGRENLGKSWLCGKHHGMGGNVLPSASLKSIWDIKTCQEDLGTHPAIWRHPCTYHWSEYSWEYFGLKEWGYCNLTGFCLTRWSPWSGWGVTPATLCYAPSSAHAMAATINIQWDKFSEPMFIIEQWSTCAWE